MRLIDADALNRAMYHEAFETDSEMQKWDSGCWIRFKMFEKAIKAAPTIETKPVQQWISVKDRLPESGKHVLATCEIRLLYGYKKQYVCEAYYAKEHSVPAGGCPEDTDCYDYSEEDDEYYLKEGWYEVIHNWDEYGGILIGDFVTHWMPLPELPEENDDER